MMVHPVESGFKPDAHPRTHIVPADDGPGVLPYRPEPIPVTWFARLVNSLRERDQPAIDEARKELRRLGYNVVLIGTPKKGGRACHR